MWIESTEVDSILSVAVNLIYLESKFGNETVAEAVNEWNDWHLECTLARAANP